MRYLTTGMRTLMSDILPADTQLVNFSTSTYLQVLGFLAELSLCLWLLVMGVNVQRWKEQAGAAIQ
jgi:hypothetical protein